MGKKNIYDSSKQKSTLLSSLEYIFAFFTILMNSIFIVSISKIGLIIKLLWIFVLIILSTYSFMHLKPKKINNLFLFMLLFIFFISLFLIFNYLIFPFNKFYIFLLLIVPLMLMVYFYYCLQNKFFPSLLYKFENIMLIIAVVSLFFWILASLGFTSNMSIISHFGANFDGTEIIKSNPGYFGIYFIPQGYAQFFGLTLIRNAGIFIEAPIYSSMLNITLLIELFLRSNKRIFNFKVILIIITLITTASTNGILITLFTILFAFYFSLNNTKLKMFLLLLTPFTLILIIFIIKIVMIDKFSTSFNSSYALRINDIFASLSAWKNHLFIGNGLENMMSIIQYMDPRRWNYPGGTGISPGLTTELARGGIAYIIIYLLPMFLPSKYSKRMFGFSVCLLLLFVVEDISQYYIFITILSYLWMYYIFYKS